LLDDLCQRSRMVERGFVDGGAWRRAVTLASHGMVENLSQFMAAASLEIWLRQIETKTGPAGAPWSALTLVEPGQLADRQSPPGAP
jgi:hypothetical protein